MRENPKTRREDAIDRLSFVNFYGTRERITVLRYFFYDAFWYRPAELKTRIMQKVFWYFSNLYISLFSFQS